MTALTGHETTATTVPSMAATGAIFVLGGTTAGQRGPVASHLSTAGWASAARRVLGSAWVVTPAGAVSPEQMRRAGSSQELRSDMAPRWKRRVPTVAKTAARDALGWRQARRFRVAPTGPWSGSQLAFVWQRHEMFHRAGVDLARALRVPSVVFAPAALVWEAQQWRVRRPGWGRAVEHAGEARVLRDADLVACGSDLVAEQVARLGVPDERLLVTPTGVDLDLFDEAADGAELRQELGLDEHFVVGWAGSFRRFHALEQAVEALTFVDGAALLLVGDGPERAGIERLARAWGVEVRATGTLPHDRIPDHLAAMDVALVVAAGRASFHYSPLKLAEYLAAGLPVVAPRVPALQARLDDGVDAVFVPPGDTATLAATLVALRDDPVRRAQLAKAARAAAEESWSWDHQVERVVAALDAIGGR
jgi:glycosyltransferase involved in cell wall biosynthesis